MSHNIDEVAGATRHEAVVGAIKAGMPVAEVARLSGLSDRQVRRLGARHPFVKETADA
jgi:hypothetical protein